QFPVGDQVGPKAAQDWMRGVPPSKPHQLAEGIPNGSEDPIHVQPAAAVYACPLRFRQQSCQLGLQVDQFVPSDSVSAFQIANTGNYMHGPICLSFRVRFSESLKNCLNAGHSERLAALGRHCNRQTKNLATRPGGLCDSIHTRAASSA